MTLKKLLLTIAGAAGIIGCFLPWYGVSASFMGASMSESKNAFGVGGWLYVVLAILTIIASAALILVSVLPEKKIKSMVPKIKNLAKAPMILGIVMAASAVIAFIALLSNGKDSLGLGSYNSMISVNQGVCFGVYLIAIAGAATIVLSVLKNKELDKVIAGAKPAAKKSEKK